MTTLSEEARGVLARAVLCHVAATTRRGPHLTPLVFAVAGDRIWVTTSRGSTKARAWRADDRVAGLVRDGDSAVTFAGRAAIHDALAPATWVRSALEAPLVALATARFTRKNARFFAGYAVDANHVPFAWSPPGRVFVELRLERWALLERSELRASTGDWPPAPTTSLAGATSSRGATGDPLAGLPRDLDRAIGERGDGALAVDLPSGTVVIPATWVRSRRGVVATTDVASAALVGVVAAEVPVALEVDRPSAWRARDMVGVMVRGLARGRTTRTGVSFPIVPERLVWWRGWESGTVMAA